MPTIDHKYKTSYAFAQDLVQLYAPLTQRCLLPSYRKPDITVKISSTCDPDFAALMKSVCAKLDLTDQAQFSDEECRLFRYYRMHGPHKLYRTGLSGQHLFASQRYHQERLFMLMYSLANLLGEKILSRLGREQFARWFPWNAFRCGFDKSGRGFTLHCASLARRVTKDGHPFYYSSQQHTVTLRGKPRIVAFSPHAIQRIGERTVLLVVTDSVDGLKWG